MGILARLFRQIAAERGGARHYQTHEVRRLIDRGELGAAEKAIDLLIDTTPKRDLVRTCLRAELTFRQFRDAEAETLFRDALREVPGLADAHYGLSLVLLARGDADMAVRHAQFAVTKAPEAARFKAQLGLCQLELLNFGRAQSALADATRLDPEDKSSWNNYGITLRAAGSLERAKKAFERALTLDAEFSVAAQNLALLERDLALVRAGQDVPEAGARSAQNEGTESRDGSEPEALQQVRFLAAEGRTDEAMQACEALVADWPDDFRPSLEIYRLYADLGDVQSGLDAMQAFITRRPEHVQAVAELGKALERAGDYQRAAPLLEQALLKRPDDVSLLLSMALVREKQLRFEDCGTFIDKAYRLEPSFQAKGRLAASLVNRCRYEEALTLIDEMLGESPGCAEGVLLMQVESYTQLGQQEKALPLVERHLAQQPNNGGLRFVRATIRLLNEDYGAGWDDYAFRALGTAINLRVLAFPQWRGEPLKGKRILVLAEQGLGDQVMLSSCLPDLLALGPAKVVVEAIDRVAPTLARSFPDCEVVSTRQDSSMEWVRRYPDMDYFVPMGELPQQFRRAVSQFPSHRGYLKASSERVEYWRQVLGGLGPEPKIGLSWRGGTEQTRTVVRSMRPEDLATLTHGMPAQWVCLQYGKVDEDLTRAREAGLSMHYWKPAIDNLDDFAALICALDQVITVCNTTVHYAGALGQPVWVMAPKVPEWRYGLRSKRLPWYPSSRIYRQPAAGDWGSVIARMRQDLSSGALQDVTAATPGTPK